MIKLIISDMDGTLLNNKSEIDVEFWNLLEKINEKGIIFAIASGRPYYNLANKFKSVQDKLLFIAENGSLVVYKNKEMFSSIISPKDIKIIKEFCTGLNKVIPIYCTKDFAYIEERYSKGNEDILNNEIAKYYDNLKVLKNIEVINENFIKVAICDQLGSENNSYPILKQYKDKFQIVLSGEVWTDISKIGTNKGKAIEEAQRRLNISYEETMAFGDYLNDLEMMKQAKYSYAMKNAHENLKKIAKFITKEDNNDIGVIKTIKEVLSI